MAAESVTTLYYPIELGIAYLLIVGYAVRVLFTAFRLPGPVGLFLVGYTYSFFFQESIYAARKDAQDLAFFLVLLNSGFEVKRKNLTNKTLAISCVPATLELIGIAVCAQQLLGYTFLQGLVVGTVLCPLGEGLVIPKMLEFRKKFPNASLPNVVLTWAPLEATFILNVFGVLEGIVNLQGSSGGILAVRTVARLFGTLAAGALLGGGVGKALSNIERVKLLGRKLFTGSAVEAFLFTVGAAMIAYSLGYLRLDAWGDAPLFDPELFVIVTGAFFAHFAEPDIVHGVEGYIAGAWVFGAIVLFTMLGSRTQASLFSELPTLLPLMAAGLVMRFLGICLVPLLISRRGVCKVCKPTFWYDVLFCFLSTLPRATIQGALGPRPLALGFFEGDENQQEVQDFIESASKLYIVCYAIIGSLLLELMGPKLLAACDEAHRRRLSNRLSKNGDIKDLELRIQMTRSSSAFDLDDDEEDTYSVALEPEPAQLPKLSKRPLWHDVVGNPPEWLDLDAGAAKKGVGKAPARAEDKAEDRVEKEHSWTSDFLVDSPDAPKRTSRRTNGDSLHSAPTKRSEQPTSRRSMPADFFVYGRETC